MLQSSIYCHYNRLINWHPAEKALLSIPMLLIAMFFNNGIFYTLLIVTILITNSLTCYISPKLLFTRLLWPSLFIIIGSLTAYITINQSTADNVLAIPLGSGGIFMTQESLHNSLTLMGKGYSSLSILYFTAGILSISEITYLAQKARIPTILIDLIILSHHFIFLILNRSKQIKQSQISRLGYKGFTSSLTAFSAMATATLAHSISEAESFHHALEARGYSGTIPYLGIHPGINLTRINSILISQILVIITILTLT